jgi:hypothetical protein
MPDEQLPWTEVALGLTPIIGLVVIASVGMGGGHATSQPLLLVQLTRFVGWMLSGLYALLAVKYLGPGHNPPPGQLILFLVIYVPILFALSYAVCVVALTVGLQRAVRRIDTAGETIRGSEDAERVKRAVVRYPQLDRLVSGSAAEPLSAVVARVCPARRVLRESEEP